MINICIATVAYRGWRGDEFDETLADGAKAGYKYIEVQSYNNRFDKLMLTGEKGLREARERLKNAGLIPVAMYGPSWGGANEEEVIRKAELILTYVNASKSMGIKTLVSTDGQRVENGLDMIVMTIRELIPELEKTGIRIGLEPHYKNRIETYEDYEYIFDKVGNHPNVGVCVDTGHFHSSGVDAGKIIRKWHDRIFHVHVKDHVGTQSVRFGHGDVDNAGVAKTLKEIGYNGYLSAELEVEDKSGTPEYTREAREYLEKILG